MLEPIAQPSDSRIPRRETVLRAMRCNVARTLSCSGRRGLAYGTRRTPVLPPGAGLPDFGGLGLRSEGVEEPESSVTGPQGRTDHVHLTGSSPRNTSSRASRSHSASSFKRLSAIARRSRPPPKRRGERPRGRSRGRPPGRRAGRSRAHPEDRLRRRAGVPGDEASFVRPRPRGDEAEAADPEAATFGIAARSCGFLSHAEPERRPNG